MRFVLLSLFLMSASLTALAKPNYRTFHPQNTHGTPTANSPDSHSYQSSEGNSYIDYLEGPFEWEEIPGELRERKGEIYLRKYIATGYIAMPLENDQTGYYVTWSVFEHRNQPFRSEELNFKNITPYKGDRYIEYKDNSAYIEGPFMEKKEMMKQLLARRKADVHYKEIYTPVGFVRKHSRYYILWTTL